jgi:hypothetical protein
MGKTNPSRTIISLTPAEDLECSEARAAMAAMAAVTAVTAASLAEMVAEVAARAAAARMAPSVVQTVELAARGRLAFSDRLGSRSPAILSGGRRGEHP